MIREKRNEGILPLGKVFGKEDGDFLVFLGVKRGDFALGELFDLSSFGLCDACRGIADVVASGSKTGLGLGNLREERFLDGGRL